MDEIVNRVKESGLISLDLGSYKPSVELATIDIAATLWQGLVLREREFRSWVKDHDWKQYNGKAVNIYCSVDAIIPTWAYMLIASQLIEQKIEFIVGTRDDLEKKLIQNKIQKEDLDKYVDARIIIKGCADITDPAFSMTELIKHLQPVAKSIMYGEPCSTVPVFKKK